MLKQKTNFNVSFHLRAIVQKSFENSMILPAALSGRCLFLMKWCGERCSLSPLFLTWTVVGGRRFRPSVAVVNGRRFSPTFGHLVSCSQNFFF